MPAHSQAEQGDIVWLPELAEGHVAEYSVILTVAGMVTSDWPGKRGMGTSFVGRLPLPDGATVWIVNRTRPAAAGEVASWPAAMALLPEWASARVRAAESADSDLRGILVGHVTEDGSRFFVDVRFAWPQEGQD